MKFKCRVAGLLFIGIVACLTGNVDAVQDSGSEDRGTNDPIVLAKQALSNQLDKASSTLTDVQRVSVLKMYERQLRKDRKQLSDAVFLDELGNVASLYWKNRAYQEATETFGEIARDNPGTVPAANAYLMMGWIEYGNRRKPEGAVDSLEKAVATLKQLPSQGNFGRNELAARALSTLGDVYMIVGRDEDAAKQYQFLLDHQEIVDAAESSALINANVEWARILARQGRIGESIARYQRVDELVKNSDLSAGMRIAFSLESWRVQSRSKMSEQEIIFFLEELWFGERGNDDMQILYLGNNLAIYYFFSKAKEQNGKFMSFSNEFLARSDEISKAIGKSFTKDNRDSFDSIVQQTLLMRTHAFEAGNNRKKVKESTTQFTEQFPDTAVRFKPFVPTRFPKKVASTFVDLHKKHIVPLLKKSILDSEVIDTKQDKAKVSRKSIPKKDGK